MNTKLNTKDSSELQGFEVAFRELNLGLDLMERDVTQDTAQNRILVAIATTLLIMAKPNGTKPPRGTK